MHAHNAHNLPYHKEEKCKNYWQFIYSLAISAFSSTTALSTILGSADPCFYAKAFYTEA